MNLPSLAAGPFQTSSAIDHTGDSVIIDDARIEDRQPSYRLQTLAHKGSSSCSIDFRAAERTGGAFSAHRWHPFL
jgi:hypothetical protein